MTSTYGPTVPPHGWPIDGGLDLSVSRSPEPDAGDKVVHFQRSTPPPLRRAAVTARMVAPPANSVLETDFQVQSREEVPDKPFRAPSLWRSKASQNERPVNAPLEWSERSTAAFVGFAAGMLIIVPMMFYLSTQEALVGAAPDASGSRIVAADAKSQAQFNVASIAGGQWTANGAGENSTSASGGVLPVGAATSAADFQALEREVRATAKALIADRRLADARALLRKSASPEMAGLWFILAETYDPTMTDASSRPESVVAVADSKFAQYYYNQASVHGMKEAKARLARLAVDQSVRSDGEAN